jgi:hypothetical protein
VTIGTPKENLEFLRTLKASLDTIMTNRC